MRAIDLSLAKGAIFSEDREYRYALWRVWQPNKILLMAIGLNPSIASELTDDPTITRLQARAYKEGYGGLLMSNLYAFISTNPDNLLNQHNTEPVAKLASSCISNYAIFYGRIAHRVDRQLWAKSALANIAQNGLQKPTKGYSPEKTPSSYYLRLLYGEVARC